MLTDLPITLAAIEDFIVPIIAVAMVISGIINSSREAKKAKEARARKRQSRSSSDIDSTIGADTSNSNLPTLEEIAEQRRRQLDSLSRKKTGTRTQQPDQSSKDAIAAERAAAKKEYEARAESLRREKAEAANQARAAERRQRKAEDLRRQQEQQQRERAARAAEKRQQRQQAQSKRSLQTLGSGDSSLVSSSELGRGATEVEDTHTGFGTVHRHVKDVPPLPVVQIGHASEIRALVKGHALRNAILLKEVLDRPLALRNDEEPSDPFAI